MSVALLQRVLEQRDGMRFDELAERRLRRALEATGAPGDSDDARARRVLDDPELQAVLLDRITLQESSFFRDPRVWDDLATQVLPAAIRAAAGGPLAVWSAGCANGQEPWSLAMLLTELGAPRFEVVATDVSGAAVARTRAGRYAERELRGLGAERRERFLVPVAGGWEVAPSLRRHLRAHRQNVVTDPPMVADGSCSVVLCRYLMIYLTPGAADQLLERVAAALAPGGRLLIGAAESLWHLSERFTAEALPHAVAYHRRTDADEAPRARGPRASVAGPDRLPGEGRMRIGAHDAVQPLVRRTAGTTPVGDTGPRTAVSMGSPDAAALVRDGERAAARGDMAAAAAAFRGAVYLDPDHVLAHAQLGVVLDAIGDPGAQRAYRSARAAVRRRPPGELEATLGSFAASALGQLLDDKLPPEDA